MLIGSYSFFKTLVDHEVTVELKNDISIRGTLNSVDQFLNINLDDIQVVEELKYPHLVCAIDPERRARAATLRPGPRDISVQKLRPQIYVFSLPSRMFSSEEALCDMSIYLALR